jgi:hypothetical protein
MKVLQFDRRHTCIFLYLLQQPSVHGHNRDTEFFTCLPVGWPMRSLTLSIAIFYKMTSSANLEATTTIIANTALSTLMFSKPFFNCE